MKTISVILLLISVNICADNSIIELLESNGISTEELVIETTHEMSGEETEAAVSNHIKRELFTQYAKADLESPTGQCLVEKILGLYSGSLNAQQLVIEPGCDRIEDHYVIDPESASSAARAVEIAWQACHPFHEPKSAAYLFTHGMIPQFIEPQNLLNVIDDLYHWHYIIHQSSDVNAALDAHHFSDSQYQLSDGVVYRCAAIVVPGVSTTTVSLFNLIKKAF